MSSALLDTSAYSAFKRRHSGLVHALQSLDEIALSPVVLGELRSGFLKGSQLKQNLEELEAFLASPRVRIVRIDEETAERYAVILRSLQKLGKPIPTNDIWIAASAMQHGYRVLTTDQHYLSIEQIVVDYLPVGR